MTEKAPRLYLKIANIIIEKIKSEEYPVGHRLPAERDLSSLFEVSRSSLREALIALELNDIVDIHKGFGVVVTNAPRNFISIGELITPAELIEAREAIEPEVARLAARKASEKDIEKLRQIQQMMESALHLGSEQLREAMSAEADALFHAELAAIANNPLLSDIVDKSWAKSARGEMWSGMTSIEYSPSAPQYRQLWVDDHNAILQAIESGNEQATYDAALKHLHNVRNVVTNFDIVEE